MADFPRKLFAETLGTMLLLTVVIGSGIMAERLSVVSTSSLRCLVR